MKRPILILILLCGLTSLAQETILWTEGFEDHFPPAEWIENSVDQVTTYALNGLYSARLNAAGDYLITPPVSGDQVIFWTYTTSADPLVIAEIATTADGPWSEAQESPFSGYTQQWNGRFLDISGMGPVHIRFRKSGTGTLYLDDIALAVAGPANQPPVMELPGGVSGISGDLLSFEVNASDPDGDPVSLWAEHLPPGAVFAAQTNNGTASSLFVWNPAGPAGLYMPVFYASDGSSTVSRSVELTVSDPPAETDFWEVVFNLPFQSASGTLHPAQYRIRDFLVEKLNNLQPGNSAILATFTFSANEGAGAILNAMANALDRGAHVSFIADGNISLATIYGGSHSLLSLSARPDNPLVLAVDSSLSGIMHHKFGLFDYGGTNKQVFTASWNFTLAASANQWNIAIYACSPSLYALYHAEAAEMLAGRFQRDKSHGHDAQPFDLPGSWGANRVRFSPSPDSSPGGNNAQQDILQLIHAAESEILFALNKLNLLAIRDALIAAANRGVRVRGVIPSSDTAPGGVSAQIFQDLNDPARYTTTNRVQFLTAYAKADYSALDNGESDLVHTKYMVIDPMGNQPIVIHGSPNWSASGLVSTTANDENLLFLRHAGIASEFLSHFERMTALGPFREGNSTLVRWDFSDGDQVADGGIAENLQCRVERVPAPPALSFISGALSANGWDQGAGLKYWETSFSTRQHRFIQLSSVQFSTTTGPSLFQLQYKTGTHEEYRDVPGGTISVDTGRRGQIIRLPLPPDCDHQDTVFLRWLMAGPAAVNGGNVSAAGASRIDDILITGTAYDRPPVLDPIGHREVFEGQPLSFSVRASDPADGDPVTLSASGLPPGASFANGEFVWSRAAPAGRYPVTFSATDKDGTVSETIVITVVKAPRLLISEVADPAGTGGDAFRFVELYNAGETAIDLAADGWHLSRQVNGGSTWQDVALTGRVDAASTYLIAKSRSDFVSVYGIEPQQESPRIDGNGDDAYFLFRGGGWQSGMLVDLYGEIDTDGTGTAWDYEDSRAVRNDSVLYPSPVWKPEEWTIQRRAGPAAMTPGAHGPRPVFIDLPDPFVFLGDSLSLHVVAVNTVRTDVITLKAESLPPGATFQTVTGTDRAASTLAWTQPPEGVFSAEISASGHAGQTIATLTITVAARTRIDGWFHGWSGDTIFRLENGQFWRQTTSGSKPVAPPLFRPQVTVTNLFGQRRLLVEGISGYATVQPQEVWQSRLASPFTGLRFERVYTLDDGTSWKQISFETRTADPLPALIWRYNENGVWKLRFLDSMDAVIGTCTVIPVEPPPPDRIVSAIDGWFRGWEPGRVFILANGECWQQVSLNRLPQTLFRPTVTLTDWLQSGRWRMAVAGVETPPDYVEVRRLHPIAITALDGLFCGFAKGRFYRMQDGTWWRQRSGEWTSSILQAPRALIWRQDATVYLELPDEGRRTEIEPVHPWMESPLASPYSGLNFGNTYTLAGGSTWLQLSFEKEPAALQFAEAMLFADEGHIRMVFRTGSGEPAGSCLVGHPEDDSDGNGIINLHEVIAGTDPLNPLSRFDVVQPDPDVLRWDAVEGRIYTVEWTPSLNQPFTVLESGMTWPQNSWTNTLTADTPEGFYRLRVDWTPPSH